MDEVQLASADPLRLLDSIQGQASERKLRVLACACCSHVRYEPIVRLCRRTVAVAERFADGLATADELRKAQETSFNEDTDLGLYGVDGQVAVWIAIPEAFDAARGVLSACLESDKSYYWIWERQLRRECRARYTRLVAEVFDPLLSRPVGFAKRWRTSTVKALAEGIYNERAFDRLPILADALQDAYCNSDELLSHLRSPVPHVRGCWALDLVLGKE